jgi:hypothetical protein
LVPEVDERGVLKLLPASDRTERPRPHDRHIGCLHVASILDAGAAGCCNGDMRMRLLDILVVLVFLVGFLGRADTAGWQSPANRFDRSGWEADYAALKHELERSYSHLAWFGSPQAGTDLPSLERTTRLALQNAGSNADAESAIRQFVADFHDGHFSVAAASASFALLPEPPIVETAATAGTACAAFGFAPVTRIAFSTPFESLSGFALVSDGIGESFRTGLIEQSGLRIGIVRIPRFRPQEFPLVCERAWQSIRLSGREPTRTEVNARAGEEWLRLLAERLARLKALGARALVVDIGDNGGGNDLGDWAVRLFTRGPVTSAPLLISAGPVAIPYFDEQLNDLRRALAAEPASGGATRRALQDAIAAFERRKQDAVAPACDMSWVWREQREWRTSVCKRLIASGFASGALAYADQGSLPAQAAETLYWASRADAFRGAWEGPTYVLTNPGTGSAAEMFAALIRDRGIAKTIGRRTFGLGCGFMVSGGPFVLPHSRLAFNIPNCVRLRADGTDEVAGVAPDIPVMPSPGEGARSVAMRMLGVIAGDARSAASR